MDDSTHARLIELATEPDGRGRHTSTLIVEALDLMVPRHQKKDVFHDLNPIRIRVKDLASDAPREAVIVLMEAALPNFIRLTAQLKDRSFIVRISDDPTKEFIAHNPDEARALLIATLKAHRGIN